MYTKITLLSIFILKAEIIFTSWPKQINSPTDIKISVNFIISAILIWRQQTPVKTIRNICCYVCRQWKIKIHVKNVKSNSQAEKKSIAIWTGANSFAYRLHCTDIVIIIIMKTTVYFSSRMFCSSIMFSVRPTSHKSKAEYACGNIACGRRIDWLYAYLYTCSTSCPVYL